MASIVSASYAPGSSSDPETGGHPQTTKVCHSFLQADSSACNWLKVYLRSGLAGKRVYSFVSAAWRHHLSVLTEERKETQIA
jgi:hypothetical protein